MVVEPDEAIKTFPHSVNLSSEYAKKIKIKKKIKISRTRLKNQKQVMKKLYTSKTGRGK